MIIEFFIYLICWFFIFFIVGKIFFFLLKNINFVYVFYNCDFFFMNEYFNRSGFKMRFIFDVVF